MHISEEFKPQRAKHKGKVNIQQMMCVLILEYAKL